MKPAPTAVLSVLAIVLAVVLSFGLASSQEPAYATEHTCTVTALGSSPNLTVTCTDASGDPVSPSEIDVQDIVGGVVTVVVENEIVKEVIKEVKVPGPTKTVTVRPAPVRVTETVRPAPVRVTETVRAPSERETVFVAGEPRRVFVAGPTRTVTAQPEPAKTVTETATPTRQEPKKDATMSSGDSQDFFSPEIDFGDDRVTAGEVGISLLSLLLLMALALLALYTGYVLGYKDKERKDTHFMRALLEAASLRRGNHS